MVKIVRNGKKNGHKWSKVVKMGKDFKKMVKNGKNGKKKEVKMVKK